MTHPEQTTAMNEENAVRVSNERLVDLIGQLREGCMRCGESDDGNIDLYDIEGANDLMYEAADALLALRAADHPAVGVCETCNGTGNEGRHSICRDCDGEPLPPPSPAATQSAVVSEEMVERVLTWVREDVLPAYGITHNTRASDPEMIEGVLAALSNPGASQ